METCTHIKTKGVEIYTVAFEIPGQTAKDLLQSCASSPSKFFDVDNGAELADAFRKIAQDFSPLRLKQ